MCAIIDACVASRVLVADNDADYGLIKEYLFSEKLQIVYGGKLLREYEILTSVLAVIRVLDQAGAAKSVLDTDIDEADDMLKSQGTCRSNDTHIIALASCTGARLLCSADQLLHQDFKNSRLLNNPRGKVYQSLSHRNLLRRICTKCNKSG